MLPAYRSLLVVVVLSLGGIAVVRAADAHTTAPSDSPEVTSLPDTIRQLTGMIRAAERSRAEGKGSGSAELRFFEPFFLGGLYGDQLLMAPMQVDPRRLDTLVENFNFWEASARASLLLTYARVKTRRGGQVGGGDSDDPEVLKQRVSDTEEANRILQVVRSAHYARAWRPFVKSYRQCAPRLKSGIEQYTAAHPEVGFQDLATHVVDPIATGCGLRAQVERSVIAPADVAVEMVRLVRETMRRHGLADDPNEVGEEQLFYSCGSGRGAVDLDQVVHVLPWHPGAAAFFDAINAGTGEEKAAQIQRMFEGLKSRFGAWLREHKEADTLQQDGELRRIASELGLFTAIEEYAATKRERSESAPALPAPPPSSRADAGLPA